MDKTTVQEEQNLAPGSDRSKEMAELLGDIPVRLTVELGRRKMKLTEVMALGAGAVVELGKAAGEALDIYVNDRLVARGEAVVTGGHYGVRVVSVLAGAGSEAAQDQGAGES